MVLLSYISLIKKYDILTFFEKIKNEKKFPKGLGKALSEHLLCFMQMIPIFQRSHLRVFLEGPHKIPQIIISAL